MPAAVSPTTALPRYRVSCLVLALFADIAGLGFDLVVDVRLVVDAALLFEAGLLVGKGMTNVGDLADEVEVVDKIELVNRAGRFDDAELVNTAVLLE